VRLGSIEQFIAAIVLLAAPWSIGFGLDQPSKKAQRPSSHTESLVQHFSVEVRKYVFEGNTAFSDKQLAQLLEPFTNRKISDEDLEEARRVLSQHYVNHGYINSGAILPDQSIIDGFVKFQIVEGVLTDVNIRGNKRLNTTYIRKRVERGAAVPFSLVHLRDQLEIIRQDPNIARINAELKPGILPGESYLDLLVEESDPIHTRIRFSNNQSASLGAEQFDLLVSLSNLTGNGDSLYLDYGITDGGWDHMDFADDDDISIYYSIPINEYDFTLTIGYEKNDSLIVEEPFDALDITSKSETFSLVLKAPIYRTPDSEFAISLTGERSTSRTFLLGLPFNLSAGSNNGVSKITSLRFGQEYTTRNQRSALALRSTFSFGLDILDSTDNPSRNPDDSRAADGTFFSWQGQFQYVQRLGSSANQLVIRASAQLTDDPLMAAEQFSIGGIDTVRGYRENQIVTDKGFVASVESRIPILFNTAGNGVLYVVPFLDVGVGKNANGTFKSLETTSVGLGFLLHLEDRVDAELYWGHPFRDFENSNNDLQDKGILFKVVVKAF